MDPHSVYEIISGQNTIIAAFPLRQNTVELIRLIRANYRWKDLLKQNRRAVVSTDAFSMLCEVSPFNLIKKIGEFPRVFRPFPVSPLLLGSSLPLSFICELDLLSTSHHNMTAKNTIIYGSPERQKNNNKKTSGWSIWFSLIGRSKEKLFARII